MTVKISGSSLILGLLGIAFIVLKLCGVIYWSWWFVLAPFWVPPVFVVALILFVAVIVKGRAPRFRVKRGN